jgi:hypothetical protein
MLVYSGENGWIGLTDKLGSSKGYTWVDETSFNYALWAFGEPIAVDTATGVQVRTVYLLVLT